MFSNLDWTNITFLLLLALFIFGDKLPQMISDGLRMLRNLRRMARDATTDLSRELGTDIQLEDLHPKTFIRKHILTEDDQEALVRPLKGISEDLAAQARDLDADVREVRTQVQESPTRANGAPARNRNASRANAAASAPGGGAAPAGGADPSLDATSPVDPAVPAPRRSYDDMT